jgi:outer membrane receptor protein involved in Fe transport
MMSWARLPGRVGGRAVTFHVCVASFFVTRVLPAFTGISCITFAALAVAHSPASAQRAVVLPEISVSAETRAGASAEASPSSGEVLRQPNNSASEERVSGDQINSMPVSRPGEALEIAPGLVVTQHSGEGKANQYFLRGFNLDHGTDLAITVDGMPVNMRTHGHGQGYADINFLIPELISSMLIRKGPYFADLGDFSSAGALDIDYARKFQKNFVGATFGSFGYQRSLAIGSMPLWAGTVLSALEVNRYNGPWDEPDNVRKINGVLRYSQGTVSDGFTLTGMAYSNAWTSTDQVAQRAIDEGRIGRFGTLDPTDGGKSQRYSLSSRWSQSTANTQSKVEAYVINSSMTLFNNFTYYLDDPVNGDQFRQTDRRTLLGLNASHLIRSRFGDFDTEHLIGFQTRYDDIHLGLAKTAQRTTLSTVRDDHVKEGSIGIYGQNTMRWTDWFRTIVGLRGDFFQARVNSDMPENSGEVSAGIASPKAGIVFGPFAKTEIFLNAGTGLHSNDARGSTITVDPADKVTPLQRSPLLVRSRGAEVGVKTNAIWGLESAVALFVLDFNSELLFVGDAGTTEASRPSRRVGVEWTNRYAVTPWLSLDLDLAFTRARFTDDDPAGSFIPGAPDAVVTGGLVLGRETGWYGSAKVRYFGPRPLVEDDSVRSLSSTVVNARLGYKFENGVRIQLDAFNLFDAKTNQIEYYYASRLPGEPLAGVEDRHIHPIEPLAFRLTLAGQF